MSKMRHKSYWSFGPLLLLLPIFFLSFTTLTCAQLVKRGVQDPWSFTSSEPATCTFIRQEELISCRGVNHTQLVDDLAKIRQQIDGKEPVVEGRNLEDGDVNEEVLDTDDEMKNNRTLEENEPSIPAGVRELTIISCDVPKLSASNLKVASNLKILSVVSSGVKEVRPDALNDHAHTLMRLTLSHNSLNALPEALQNLTQLEVLDLSHNEINHLPEGSLLFNLHRLRQLQLDHNKLGQILGAQARLGLQSPGLSLTVFNLEPLRDSLTQLSLAHNALTAFPEQFSRPFTRLTRLDLSSNDISEVLPSGFRDMPRLQYLDLSGNHLHGFNPERLSTSLLDLNLRGNPWSCTCDSKWILESLQSNRSDLTTLTPPTCSSPIRLRHRELLSLKESDICPPQEFFPSDKVIYVGDAVDGSLKQALQSLHLLNVTALNHQALIISWRVDADFYSSQDESSEPLSWAVTLHDTKQDPRMAKVTRMKLERYKEERPDWRPSETLYTELLHGLKEERQYTLCLVPTQDKNLFTRPDQCKYVTTLKRIQYPTTSTTTTTTTTVSPTTTTNVPKGVPLVSTGNYEVKTENLVMVNEARRVIMSWNVTIHLPHSFNNRVERETVMLRPLGWKITYRQFAEENETEVVLVSRGGEPLQNFTNHYTVEDLEPGTGYTFCFHSLSDLEVRASLKANDGEVYDMGANPHIHQDPEALLSTTRGQHLHTHVNQPVTNSIESDEIEPLGTIDVAPPQIPTESSIPDYPPPNIPSNIPSNIPPIPSLQPHDIDQGIPSNIPPVPNFPASSRPFDRRPPRPPPQLPGGSFVYTSTGERIAVPSSPSGPASPFNLPSIVGPSLNFDSRPSQWSSPNHPILDIPRNPQQLFTYDFDDSATEASSKQSFTYDFTTESTTTTSTQEPQRFTYVTRRKRSVDDKSKVTFEKSLDSGFVQFCKEVVTLKEDNIITPVAIASTVSTSTTIIIAIIFCCCCPKRCRRKKSSLGWQGRTVAKNRKISTISNPTPVNVYTRHSSVISSTTLGDGSNGDVKSISSSQITANGPQFIEGDPNVQSIKSGRSVSVTSSTGYLTPIPLTNGAVHDQDRVFNEAKSYLPSQKAYLNSVKDRLLQQHKDLKDFHPGYDIPPTSSMKSLMGYDYPHPTPVNPIGTHSDSNGKPEIPNKALIPSPSSSDSNYNASINDPREVETLRPEVNLNIPFNQNKSSDLNKKFNLNKDSDLNKSIDYNYISPDDVSSKPRTYIKNGPAKTKHRKFGLPQRLPDERVVPSSESFQELGKPVYSITPLQSPPLLSRSVPDLATAGRISETPISVPTQPTDVAAAARLNLLIGNQKKEEENGTSSLPTTGVTGSPVTKGPMPSTSAEDLDEVNGYVNFPSQVSSNKDPKTTKDKDHYHTWSSSRPNTPRSRPSLGEVVLTGGTLIEVPEGYVIPKPPKPARSVRLLVPGEDKPIKPDEISVEYVPPPTTPTENKTITVLPPIRKGEEASQITHLMTPELDNNRIVISTGMAV